MQRFVFAATLLTLTAPFAFADPYVCGQEQSGAYVIGDGLPPVGWTGPVPYDAPGGTGQPYADLPPGCYTGKLTANDEDKFIGFTPGGGSVEMVRAKTHSGTLTLTWWDEAYEGLGTSVNVGTDWVDVCWPSTNHRAYLILSSQTPADYHLEVYTEGDR